MQANYETYKTILKENLNYDFDNTALNKIQVWQQEFIKYNNHTNLMSKNDIDVLFNKHVIDCLSILKWKNFSNFEGKILDVGTGGGFPSVVLAIFFPNLEIIANDSRIKKINFIKHIKECLNLENLEILYSRIEDAKPLKADIVISRAVGKIIDIYKLSNKHLKKTGFFINYKSKLTDDEIKDFKNIYKKAKVEIIPYKLPLKETFERNLVIIKNQSI